MFHTKSGPSNLGYFSTIMFQGLEFSEHSIYIFGKELTILSNIWKLLVCFFWIVFKDPWNQFRALRKSQKKKIDEIKLIKVCGNHVFCIADNYDFTLVTIHFFRLSVYTQVWIAKFYHEISGIDLFQTWASLYIV